MSVVHAVARQLPLNQKQRLLTERIIHGALTCENQAHDSDKVEQLLMCTEDAGMAQVIKATVAAMEILQRADELMLLAPTGAAAYHIGANTIHHALRTPRLWTSKTVMIVNNASIGRCADPGQSQQPVPCRSIAVPRCSWDIWRSTRRSRYGGFLTATALPTGWSRRWGSAW